MRCKAEMAIEARLVKGRRPSLTGEGEFSVKKATAGTYFASCSFGGV